jgi:hypothetical protein
METIIHIRIAARKVEGYPTTSHTILFDGDIDEFERKVDKLTDELGYGKVDVYIDNPEEFNDEQQEELEERFFII